MPVNIFVVKMFIGYLLSNYFKSNCASIMQQQFTTNLKHTKLILECINL